MANRRIKSSDLPPVQLLRRIDALDPGVFDRVDALPRDSFDGLDYLSVQSVQSVASFRTADMDDIAAIHAVAAWRKHKVVYHFAPELAQEIIDGDSAGDIDVSALQSLPYDGIYIDLSNLADMVGAFLTRTTLPPSSPGLILLLLYRDGMISSLPLYLRQGWTMTRAVNFFARLVEDARSHGAPAGAPAEVYVPQTLAFLRWFLPLILYLCADNAEIQYRPVLRDRRDAPSKHLQDASPVPDSAPQLASVGDQFAVAMRAYRKQHKDADAKIVRADGVGGAKKRPHMRAAHYAHYWIGPKNDPSKRRLILHWIAPILVGTKTEPHTVTISDVSKAKKPEA